MLRSLKSKISKGVNRFFEGLFFGAESIQVNEVSQEPDA